MMDALEIQSIIAAEIGDAVNHIDDDVGPDRAKAINMYFGRPFGNEEEGRSQVVSRDVHDTIQSLLPSLMRIFFGSENVVEFVPEGEDDQKLAEQATDYVNYVITQDNPGFEIFYDVIKNALREKVGFVKWWWDESVHVETKKYTGLDMDGLTKLLEDVDSAIEAEITETTTDDEGQMSVRIKFKRKVKRVRVAALPPEEFLISRGARTIDDARLVGHRSMRTVSDLVAMGHDKDEVLLQAGSGDDLEYAQERLARTDYTDDFTGHSNTDPSQKLVLYVEGYLRVDKDGDGIAELRKICTVGSGYRVLSDEECDERPFADFQCDPEPHTFFGQSIADKTMDIQLIKSNVWRAGMDSLTQSILPRTIVYEGDGYLEDALNTEVGAVLRSRKGKGYEQLVSAPVFQQAFPMLTYMDEVRENRTGMSKVSQGLDAEALQNTTATAAEGQYAKSQDRIDLVARIMASGMRRLFRGILRLLVENQSEGRSVPLRTGWAEVDPRAWRTNMDIICTVGLGGGSDREKGALLAMVAAKQEQIIMTAGVNNPLVTPKQYYYTLSRLLDIGGFRNPNAFFTDPESPEAQERMANAPPPPPDPKVAEGQAKLQLEQQKAEGQLQLEQAKSAVQMQMQQAEAETDAQLQQMKMQAESELAMQRMQMEGELKREQLTAELALKREQLQAELDLKRELAYAELELQREQIAMGAATDLHSIDVDAEVASSVHTGGEPG